MTLGSRGKQMPEGVETVVSQVGPTARMRRGYEGSLWKGSRGAAVVRGRLFRGDIKWSWCWNLSQRGNTVNVVAVGGSCDGSDLFVLRLGFLGFLLVRWRLA